MLKCSRYAFYIFFSQLDALHVSLIASLLGHMSQMLALGFHCLGEKPYYRRKSPLVVGETRTQVLVDNMAIASTAPNHCTTWVLSPYHFTVDMPYFECISGVTLGVKLKRPKMVKAQKKDKGHATMTFATTTPLVTSVFNQMFGVSLDYMLCSNWQWGVCRSYSLL